GRHGLTVSGSVTVGTPDGVGAQGAAQAGRDGIRRQASDLGSGARSAAADFRHRWRRSLQLRVVTATMVLGLAAVSLLGGVLYTQIAGGLQTDRVDSSQTEALALTATAQTQWGASTSTTVDELNRSAEEIMLRILAVPGSGRYVVMERSAGNGSDIVLAGLTSSRDVDISSVSEELQAAVATSPNRQQTQLTEVSIAGVELPAVIVGSVVEIPTAGPYDLYFVYPMEQEVATMGLISNAFIVAGLVLTLLVGAVAWVVTRQVVAPVRRAGEVAQRLSAGKLNERMSSRGEDDLAVLAASFNGMADSLQSQIRQLEGLSAVQQRFVSDVSHELRTPLTTIRMAVDLIHDARSSFADASVARSAELLAGELDRFEALLADLLEISRFDAGATALDVEPVDLRGTLATVVEAARPLFERRGSVVTIRTPDEPAVAEVDERRVERILRNLVVNAIEHGEGRPIDIEVATGHEAVAVVVSDHGVGLRRGDAANVFTRFWRADPARARTTGGTGLGLSISLEDARLHHGWLQAWGEPGTGSRFRLTLPQRSGETLQGSPLPLSPSDIPVPPPVPATRS
ncbi:MAG: MtrAB system histidine kinase MtrB, partial [Ornithinibacter sp.]